MGEREVKIRTTKGAVRSFAGCTIALAGELAQAVVLATSFLKFHPEADFAILVLDGSNDRITVSSATLLGLGDLDLDAGEEWRLPMLYNARELRCILKPVLLRTLLKNGATVVADFVFSTEIFGPLGEIMECVRTESPIIVTGALPNDGDESGRSFVAVGPGAETHLTSWFDRLRNQTLSHDASRNDTATRTLEGLFDSVPHREVARPGFGLGYWNLKPERFVWTGNGYEVEGSPLRSFDFRGYDPDKPHLLSKNQGLEPRILLSEHPMVAKLCDEYRGKLMRAGYDGSKSVAHRFDFLPSGLRLDHRMLRLYRDALGQYKLGAEKEPPSPFGPEGEQGFLNWLNEAAGQTQAVVTRYMLAVHDEREDVKKAFPDPIGTDAAGFRHWYLHFGQRELDLPAVLVPDEARPKSAADESGSPSAAPSVNVAGYFRAELGLGAAARSLLAALEAAQIPFSTISFEDTANRQSHPFLDRETTAGAADINIICVNADQIAAFAEKAGPELLHGRYTIGLWFWEVEDFPPLVHGAFNYVDEVWVASEFMRETFLKVSPKPVFKFKLPILKPEIDLSVSRADLGLPRQFAFFFNFDFLSVLERKNPLGLIEAFTRAFRVAEGPVLVIKTINGDKRILELEKLRYAARGRPDIILRDGYSSMVENHTLTALTDCYVSLHRSEGFGLTLAEAMALGKPAIATAYSGNLEFMNEENSYLCPGQRIEVGPECDPYPATSHWSEPDVEVASHLLRHVYTNQKEALEKGRRAAAEIQTFHAPAVAGSIIRARLAKIRSRRAESRPALSMAFLEDRVEELEALRGDAPRG